LLQLADGAIIWAGRKADDVDRVATARVRANSETVDEYRRLLYVAMTRAAERLIICGAEGLNRPPRNCWYNLVYEPLQPFLVAEDECGEKVLRYGKPMPGRVTEAEPPPAEAANADRREPPPWLFQPAAVEAPRLVSLSPSSAFAENIGRVAAPATASAAERRHALARGRIVHRPMQSLPDIPAAGRQDAIERYLKGAAADFLPAERAEIARQVLTILNDLVFADVFAPGSRAEVPIVGRIARPDGVVIAVSGQVDRLAVTGGTVLIADYKTDRAVPRRLAEVPDAYVAQLALYRAVLARIYPEKTIRAALIFTEGPNVMEVPGAAMEAALAAIMSQACEPVL
jgi:ATP-dependent helicase/nuclease subunit A